VITLGVDPGLTGAYAVLGDVDQVHDLPTTFHGKHRVIDGREMYGLLQAIRPDLVVLEDVGANSTNGSLGNFSMGHSIGTIVACIHILELPLVRLMPKAWQQTMGLGSVAAKDRKNASRAKAVELWPSLADRLKRIADHGRAEALLIGEAGRRLSHPDVKVSA
jgi:crossover junction endodeoxyribonuclease RuvC